MQAARSGIHSYEASLRKAHTKSIRAEGQKDHSPYVPLCPQFLCVSKVFVEPVQMLPAASLRQHARDVALHVCRQARGAQDFLDLR